MDRVYGTLRIDGLRQVFEDNKYNLQVLYALYDEVHNHRKLNKGNLILNNEIVAQINMINELIESTKQMLQQFRTDKHKLSEHIQLIKLYSETEEIKNFIEQINQAVIEIDNKTINQQHGTYSVDDIQYIANYYPKNKVSFTKIKEPNPMHDHFSSMILQLKKGAPDGISYFYPHLKNMKTDDHVLCVVPSSSPDSKSSGLKELITMLIKNNNQNGIDCLVRHIKVEPAKWGHREISKHLGSIKVVGDSIIQGKNIIVFDDVVTSGNTLIACRKLLIEAGANSVACFALGKTTR